MHNKPVINFDIILVYLNLIKFILFKMYLKDHYFHLKKPFNYYYMQPISKCHQSSTSNLENVLS